MKIFIPNAIVSLLLRHCTCGNLGGIVKCIESKELGWSELFINFLGFNYAHMVISISMVSVQHKYNFLGIVLSGMVLVGVP